MGAVYLAHHTMLGHEVALKVLASNLAASESVRGRFLQEARLQAQLQHPAIVHVRDIVSQGNTLAMVMEYVPGPSLENVLLEERPGPWPEGEAIQVVLNLLAGISHAHVCGVVHRDIKPGNVVMDRRRNAPWPGSPRILDFGIARLLTSTDRMTRAGSRMGTLPYMAPEQFLGSTDIDARADVFALGMLLWRLLVGSLPIDPDNQVAIYELYSGKAPLPSVSAGAPGVSDAVRHAVDAALALEPARRPRDAVALTELLRPPLGRGVAVSSIVLGAPKGRVEEPATELEVLLQVARHHSSAKDGTDLGIEAWNAILRLAPGDTEALDALEELARTRAARFADSVGIAAAIERIAFLNG